MSTHDNSTVRHDGEDAVFSRRQLMQQLGGDEQLAREVVDLFLRECPAQLSAIRAALDEGNAREVYVVAHTLKGAAGTLAAGEVTQAAQTLEQLGRDGQVAASADAWHALDTAAARLLDALRAAEFPST